jgi:tubulin--tyrosine ligase like protein 10
VDIFPSYKFVSKNWELVKYHFRSIDTWLDGVCKSCCPEHPWSTDDTVIRGATGKNSIFYVDSDDEDAGNADIDDDVDMAPATAEEGNADNTPSTGDDTTRLDENQADASASSSKSVSRKRVSKGTALSPTASASPTANFFKATSSSSAKMKNAGPKTFYVCKNNGWKLVVDAMTKRGWQQIPFEYNFSNRYGLKWVERRSQIDYKAHSAGQLVNHIPNNDCITNKVNLYATMRTYFQSSSETPWLPPTFRLDHAADCLAAIAYEMAWRESHQRDGLWIYKPSCNNRGRGIKVIHGKSNLEAICNTSTSSPTAAISGPNSRSHSMSSDVNAMPWRGLVQKYIEDPLLIGSERLKFDIRCYLLIAATHPKTKAFYHRGYCRLSLKSFTTDPSSLDDQTIHLTNAAIQKQDELYEANKEKQIQLPSRVADSLEQDGKIENARYIREQLDNDIKRCMVDVMKASNSILMKKHGYFDLLGCDFMLTENNELRLLEINTNPALSLDNSTLEDLLPGVVDASIDLVLEIQRPEIAGKSNISHPTDNPNGLELIFDESSGYCYK